MQAATTDRHLAQSTTLEKFRERCRLASNGKCAIVTQEGYPYAFIVSSPEGDTIDGNNLHMYWKSVTTLYIIIAFTDSQADAEMFLFGRTYE